MGTYSSFAGAVQAPRQQESQAPAGASKSTSVMTPDPAIIAPAVPPDCPNDGPRDVAEAMPEQIRTAVDAPAEPAEVIGDAGTATFADSLASSQRRALWSAPAIPSASSQLSIPTIEALAASSGGRLGSTVLFDVPSEQSSPAEQQLVPLPPAAWTGMIGLVGATLAAKARRFR